MTYLRAAFLGVAVIGLAVGALWFGAPQVSRALPVGDESAESSATRSQTQPAVDTAAEQKRVDELMATYARRISGLDGIHVTMGQTPQGEEAVAYYTANQIVIDTEHKVDIEKILAHEIWHIVDFRDNGRLDWGEDLPPVNSRDYYL